MPEARDVLRSAIENVRPDPGAFERQGARQRRAARNRRLGAFAAAAAIMALLALLFVVTRPSGDGRVPATRSPSPPVHPTQQPMIVGLDGTRRDLRGIPEGAYSLNVSPAGRQIVFVADQNGSPQIGTIGVDGSGSRFITQVASVSIAQGVFRGPLTPVWSPDGSRIAFSNGHIYVMNADGTGLTQLTSGLGVDQWPSWSPDGSTIAYSNSGSSPLDDNASSATQEIWTVPANGGTPTRLTHGGWSDTPAYSPDGTRIAFENGGGIFLMDANGQNPRLIKGLPTTAFSPRWSPNGKSLAYLHFSGRYSDVATPLQRVSVVRLSTGAIERIPGLVAGATNAVQWLPSASALLENRYTG
ncbi:MAG: hypothetical protein E6G43_08980 [Actinobacteria bacterium]|nr:MAG: hypothetical protein E6G43_08980 [Actinomycetota bacterium]